MKIVALVIALTLAGGCLRLQGTSFGLPDHYRPDEEHMIPFALRFGPDWNPHFALYPAGYMYLEAAALRLYAVVLGHPSDFRLAYSDPSLPYLVGRRVTALLGTATIALSYIAVAPIYGSEAGLVAAALIAFNTLHELDSKFATTDVPAAFCTVLAIVMLLRIVCNGNRRYYLWAGIFSGLAAATKYPAGVIFVAVVAAHLERVKEKNEPISRIIDSRICLAGILAIVTMLSASPFLILDFSKTVHDFQLLWRVSRYGFGSDFVQYTGHGWSWLLGRAIPDSFGIGIGALLLGGVLWAIIRPKPGTLSLAIFVVISLLAIASAHLAFYRYLLVPFPAMAILAGILVSDLRLMVEGIAGRALASGLTGLLLAALLLPSCFRDFQINRLLLRTDTRTLAREWIVARIPPGSVMAAVNSKLYGPAYGRPELPPQYEIVAMENLGSLRARHIRWVLSDTFAPIACWSPELTKDQLAALSSQHALLILDLDPLRLAASSLPRFDRADAFYLPIQNVSGMERPGPRIRIWELKYGPDKGS